MSYSCHYTRLTGVLLAVSVAVTAGCAGRKASTEIPEESKDQKIENLTNALSRAETRIEELDAKFSALQDKMDATRLAVDNISGVKPLQTETVGSARVEPDAPAPKKSTAKAAAKQPKGPNTAVSLAEDNVTAEFSKALALFKAGRYTDAELAFNHFTEQYPEHILAGSAQFYSGESYFMMGEYNLATNEYSKVITAFRTSPRVASAMVRLAQCYEAAGAAPEAAKTMTMARELFPGSPALELAPPTKGGAARPGSSGAQPKDSAQSKVSHDLSAAPMDPPELHEDSKPRGATAELGI